MAFKWFYETPSLGTFTDGKELYVQLTFDEEEYPNSTLRGTYLVSVNDSRLPDVVYRLGSTENTQGGIMGHGINKPEVRREVALELCYSREQGFQNKDPSELEEEIEIYFAKKIQEKKKK